MPLPPETTRQNTRTRRRYMQGSTRSRTIELGTLSEVEEDIYHNREGYEEPDSKTSNADCNGTIRRPTNGTVRSIARHLSERQKIERARSAGSMAGPAPPVRNEEHMHPSVSHEEVVTSVKFRPIPCIHFDHRTVRCISEHTDLRGPLAKWSPPPPPPPPPLMHHHLDECNSAPHASMSEFHPRTMSTMSSDTRSAVTWVTGKMYRRPYQGYYSYQAYQARYDNRGHATRSISRSSSMAGGLLVYDPRTMSLMDPRLAAEIQMPDYSLPVWYPLPAPQPPPLYIPLGPPVLPLPPKMLKPPKKPSVCAEMCCGGVAQMLWTLICIVLLGVVGVLITALLYL